MYFPFTLTKINSLHEKHFLWTIAYYQNKLIKYNICYTVCFIYNLFKYCPFITVTRIILFYYIKLYDHSLMEIHMNESSFLPICFLQRYLLLFWSQVNSRKARCFLLKSLNIINLQGDTEHRIISTHNILSPSSLSALNTVLSLSALHLFLSPLLLFGFYPIISSPDNFSPSSQFLIQVGHHTFIVS